MLSGHYFTYSGPGIIIRGMAIQPGPENNLCHKEPGDFGYASLVGLRLVTSNSMVAVHQGRLVRKC